MSEHKDKLLRSLPRAPLMSYATLSTEELDAFVSWSIEALELWPYSFGAKLMMNRFAVGRSHLYDSHYDLDIVESFLSWIEHANDLHPISDQANTVALLFIEYRTRLKEHQEAVKQQIRSYWSQ